MGNTESNVTSGVKKQAGASLQPIYKLCNLKGGGLLVELMKRATQNKQYAEIDHAIKTKVEHFLYNKGAGRYIPISQLVLLRNKERARHKWLPQLKAVENPEEFEIDDEGPEITEEEYQKNPHLYRHVCWKLKERGAVGETVLHLCLLNATSLHADIAKRLLKFYPKLINDIYISDEYYGENVLHIAIVNEDPSMVKFLLDNNVNFQERCFGNFMCPEDQKMSRTDSLDHEWVNVCPETNYDGYVYWGEYPLAFAACLGQEECFRLMLARGADPDAQDTNGNTVLHLLVIYQKLEYFDMAYEVGSRLSIRNVLNLTPLTLAAKLAKIDMFFHILNLEREIYWQIGSITCAAYPLSQIDTIDLETGHISKISALNLVVFGDKDEHLELMDGVIIDLLNAKWNTFVKFKFYRQFFTFAFYFLISLVAFTLRPGPPAAKVAVAKNSTNSTHGHSVLNSTMNSTLKLDLNKTILKKGGGLLVELMKRATQNKQYAEIDHAIKTKVEHFLYNKGAGRYIPISQLVLLRNKERARHKWLPQLKAVENPEEFEIDDEGPEITEEEYQKNPHLYRHVCWKLKERGAVGETVLHLCLLNATSLHADIAKRLLKFYPKLINDIYISDEYYGENVLHIAIVNEDPSMVKFLLDNNVNFQERCFGNFMCPEDQKMSRTDSLDHEWVNVCPETNYDGYVYWGEYPLAFAACLGQEECFRLMLARGADPDAQDTNGNTVLHLLVIYQKLEYFDMAYEVGSRLSIRNVLNLTPLTLAAKLAKIDMFFHILNLEREIYWQIGSITCAAYPLSQIDTIDLETGHISKISALNLVVFGDKDEHLELMDGVIIDLLNAKWNTFVKFKFYRQFFTFAFYFLISLVAFTLRPGPPAAKVAVAKNSTNSTHGHSVLNSTMNSTLKLDLNKTILKKDISNDDDDLDVEEWWDNLQEECRLMNLDTLESQIRIGAETAITVGAFLYLAAAVREARFLGGRMFFENLKTSPSRVMFLFSCTLMLTIPWLRLLCLDEIEDTVAVGVMLTTAPYFLFFCRGFKTVGPFVVMIYRMVMGDLLRFASIYLVFVMGFSQAYYIIFLSFDNPLTPDDVDDSATNPISTPIESIMAMFLMSLTNFGDYYNAFSKTEHELEAKILFVIFMGIVAILLINMLIAMMGNTYQKIAETRNEWQRQWARIVLVVERGVSPPERLKQMMVYSQPMSDDRRALVLRLNQSDEDKEEMKEILEMKRRHDRYVKKRREKLAQQQSNVNINLNAQIKI